MSDNEAKQKHFLEEVLINNEDAQSAVDFYNFFDIPMDNELKELIEVFKNNPTTEVQNKIKYILCRDVGNAIHDVFKDPMFLDIVSECKGTAYEMGFDLQLEKLLSDKGK